MERSNRKNRDKYRLLKGIEACVRGDNGLLAAEDFPQNLITRIERIMHNYSIMPIPLFHNIVASSLATHAPERALHRLERFFEAHGPSINNLPDSSDLPFILASVFSTSEVLSGRIIANPSLLNILVKFPEPLEPHLDQDYYIGGIPYGERQQNITSERVKEIHYNHTAHLIRLCARNALDGVSISEVNGELSALAEATIELCLTVAYDELITKLGMKSQPHTFIVLGLGKLGGQELNVNSDIDIIYLCGEDNEIWGKHTALSFYTLLAERLTTLLTESTSFGTLYRVDTRLRADGSSGPLVRTTRDYFNYLELRGETWERQMLLKARPVAGNYILGQHFLESLQSFIFPASITRSPNREIVELKNRIEARLITEGSKNTHLKLAPGGIRDIEFIVHCLQLLTGGIHTEVRCPGTMTALDRLRDINALSGEEYTLLTDAYIFYRRIENALQWRELLPVFTLPSSDEDINELAQYLHIQQNDKTPGEILTTKLKDTMSSVRAIYDDVFGSECGDSFETMAHLVATNPSCGEQGKRFLENLGFHDPAKSLRDLINLSVEKGEPTLSSSAELFIPKLLKALSDLPDPTGTLERLLRVVDSYKARHMLFDILDTHPSVLKLLLSITESSVFMTDILVHDPSLLDWLVEVGEIRNPLDKHILQQELIIVERDHRDDQIFVRLVNALKHREQLRIGVRDISGLAQTNDTFSALTTVAECIVKIITVRVLATFSEQIDFSFAILGAGRLGVERMNFGSDLDLIFVHRSKKSQTTSASQEKAVSLAQHLLSLITSGGGVHKLYDVDTRLRPEGENAVLSTSFEEFQRYLEQRASAWERLALMRARSIAGDMKLGGEVIRLLSQFIYQGRFSQSEIKKIMEIRTAMIDSSLKTYPGLINIKIGSGSIADIDFIAQLYSAHFGAEKPGVRQKETTKILTALAEENLLSRHDVTTLLKLYSFFSDVEKALRIGSGRDVNTLPESVNEFTRVGQLVGFKNMHRFKKRLEDVISLTQERYHHLVNHLFEQSVN